MNGCFKNLTESFSCQKYDKYLAHVRWFCSRRLHDIRNKKMIINLVKPFGSMLKVKDVNIYNTVFMMHTKLTVVFLLVFSILVSAHEFFGKPINCIMGDRGLQTYVESYCWIIGTFTEKNATKSKEHIVNEKITEYQKYYQWIIVVLLLQAVLCYIPAYLWKGWEHGRVKQICSSLASPILSKDYQEEKKRIVTYLRSDNSRIHAAYVLRYVICEIMNFLIVVINMLFLNAIFNQFWTRYLPAVLAIFNIDGELFSQLANDLFPKLTKCAYSYTGPSGSEQNRDALCLLSLNILNEKIFAFLYIWFVMLLFTSGCNLICRSIILISSNLRFKMIRSLAMSAEPMTQIEIEMILRGDNIGNWFVLYQIGRNLNPIVFREILDDIAYDKEAQNKSFVE